MENVLDMNAVSDLRSCWLGVVPVKVSFGSIKARELTHVICAVYVRARPIPILGSKK